MKIKLFHVILILFAVGAVFLLEYTKTQKIEQINKQISTLKTPMHFYFNIIYLFNKAMLTKDKQEQLEYLKTAKYFLNLIGNKSSEIEKIINEEIKKIKNGKVAPIEDTQKLSYLIQQQAKSQYLNLLNSLNNLEKYKRMLNKMFIIIDMSIVVLTIFLIMIIEYKSHKNRLVDATFKDFLTDTFNRRKFYEVIENMDNSTHSLIMLDIDNFKQINDTYGHDKGDYVLQKVVEIIRKNIRKDDYIFRWGGEEFIILLKNTTLDNACKVAQKIKEDLEKSDFQGLKVTASFGVCETNKIDNEVLQKLDNALYESKRKGKNRITIA